MQAKRILCVEDDDDGARARPSPADTWFEIVGVVRDFGLDPDDNGDERH